MKMVYKCDFCDKTFHQKMEVESHEKTCGYNPKNKITDKTLFRISMIYLELNDILAASLNKIKIKDYDYLIDEINRASENNCPFMVYQNKTKILNCLKESCIISQKRKGLEKTRLQDIEKDYPELLEAFINTLQRPARNER